MALYYVAEIHERLFANPRVVEALPRKGWRFFAHCSADSIDTCTLLCKDLMSFTDVRNKKAFVTLWEWLIEAGKSGKPWKQIFQDGKLFHPVHSFTVQRVDSKTGKTKKHEVEVHQFKKKRTDVRVLFVYGDGRLLVFVTHAFEKDGQTTPRSEQTRAEAEAKRFFDALDSGTIQLIEEQGGQDETRKIFYAD
jgi:hypothetical protein